jgi:hypothetical protein
VDAADSRAMSDDLEELRRVALIGVVLALILGAVSTALGIAAVGLEAFAFGHVDTILGAGAQAAPLWRWAMLLDIFYSYLLLIPLALYGHRRLRSRKPWLADLGLVGALAYTLLGAASAGALAIAGSSLMVDFETATAEGRVVIETSFRLLRDVFAFGIWQLVDAITAGTWALSSGWLLMPERPKIARLLLVIGAALWLLALMTMLGLHSLGVLAGIGGVAVALYLAWSVLARRDTWRRTG